MIKVDNMQVFMDKYKELKKLVTNITEILGSYIEEVDDNIGKFDEYLGDYSVKISAVVWNEYDKDKINKLLDEMEELIKKDDAFKDLDEYINSIKQSLDKFEELYYEGSIEEDELHDIHYEMEMPFEDLETIFDDEGWNYGEDK